MFDSGAGASPVLRMRGLAKAFGPVRALDGVDLEVRRGEVHALVGENGAGKSTLMKVLAGAHTPDAGSMELDGEPFAPRGPAEARRAGVAMVYQELNLAPHLTVEENLLLGCEPARFGFRLGRVMRQRARRALEILEHPEIRPGRRVAELGPGERQLVEIARARLGTEDGEARVLVLDEPTSSLSQRDAQRLFQLIERLRRDGLAIVYISHFLEEVARVAQRYTVLRDGRSVATGDVARTPAEEIVTQMVGRALDEVYPHVAHSRGQVVLKLDALCGPAPVRSASLELARGEILGVAGLVGSGRTELLRGVFGLDEVQSGSVLLGHYAGPATPAQRWEQGVGLCSEDRKEEGLALSLSVADNLTLSRTRPFACGPRALWLSRRAQRDATRGWIERVGIRCRSPLQKIGELSGGNQQKVALARLLHHDVDVLLLDEPTRGVDVGSKVELYRWIGELAAAGKAVLLVSSYLPELLGLCDSIAVMHRGVLGPLRARADWNEESLMEEATRGVSA